MFQDRTGNDKGSMWKDFVIVVLLLAMMIFLRKMLDACATLPNPWNVIAQGVVFAVLIVLCYFIYRSRITDYRYTVIYHQPAEGEENAFGKTQPYPWDEGTVLVERMVANKGRILEMIKPDEYTALLAPGEEYTDKIPFARCENLSPKSKKKSYTLVYRRDGKLGAVYFLPSDEMVNHIKTSNCAAQ